MKIIESTGKTREEAIQNGLKELGVDMHDIEKIDVIDEGSKGFLGIGSRPVRVRLTADLAEEQPGRGDNRQGRPEGRGGNRQDRQDRQGRRGDGRNERQDKPAGGRQEQQDRPSGGRQQQQDRSSGGRQQQQDRPSGGRQQQQGNRQEKRQEGNASGSDTKGREGGSQQLDRNEESLRKKKRRRTGGQDNRNDRNAQDNRGGGQNRQKPGNVHKASPVVGRKNMSVTDEATEALRRAENFENNVADDEENVICDELPPNARQDEEIETITDEQGKEAAAMLTEVLGLMDLNGEVSFARATDGSARLAIDSEEDGGILIGKRGVTLHAIQYLVNRMIAQNEAADNTERVIVDVGGYVDRRHDTLADMARSMARRAKDSGRNVRLKPLSPQERRIVHLTLEPDPQVRTYSLGDSLFRSIVINPVGGRGGGGNRRDRGPRDRNRDADAAND